MLAALLSLLLAGPTAPEFQPKTYTSASGLWSLRVEPTTRAGTTDADYVMTGGGKEAWKARLPFALWDAVVTNDGRVAGYAYYGAEMDAIDGGELRIVLLSPQGKVLLQEDHGRSASHFEHGTADPKVAGMLLQQESGRFVVRVIDDDINRQCEEWWAYDLRDGHSLLRARPKQTLGLWSETDYRFNVVRFALDARPIGGTPLVLVHWWRYDYETHPSQSGGLFTLVDPNLHLAWKLELPLDYTVPDDDNAEDRLRDEIWDEGAILSSATPMQFELRHVADAVRVTYSVAETGDGSYRVTEVERRPYVVETVPPAPIPLLRPKFVSDVRLGEGARPGGEIRDIETFAFDTEGCIRFVRAENEPDVASLVLLDETGEVLRSSTVGPFEVGDVGQLDWFPLRSPRWIAVASTLEEDTTAKAWVVDEVDGSLRQIPDFAAQDVKALCPLGDEGLILLSTWHFKYTSTQAMLACDFDGNVKWRIEQDYQDAKDPSRLFSAEDLTVTTDGRVVVLDNVRKVLQIFDSGGAFVELHELAPLLGREPNYPTRVESDVAGGVLLQDSGGDPPLWRLRADGTPWGKLDPRRADGSSTRDLRDEARVSPSGVLWTTDGHLLLRLDDAGVIDRTLGEVPRADELQEPGACAIDSTFGRILVHDRRTRNVHVFDPDGQRVTLCRPEPDEVDDFDYPLEMSTTASGEVYAADSSHTNRYLHFDAKGMSLGRQKMRLTNLAACPDSGRYWGASGTKLVLSSGAKRPEREIEKRPDGQWFRAFGKIRVAADGSVAVLDVPEFRGFGPAEGEHTVVRFSGAGEPLGTSPLPPGFTPRNMSFAAGRVLLDDYERVMLLDTRDGSSREVDLSEWISKDESAELGLSPDGREIWAVLPKGGRFLRLIAE